MKSSTVTTLAVALVVATHPAVWTRAAQVPGEPSRLADAGRADSHHCGVLEVWPCDAALLVVDEHEVPSAGPTCVFLVEPGEYYCVARRPDGERSFRATIASGTPTRVALPSGLAIDEIVCRSDEPEPGEDEKALVSAEHE